MNILYAELLSQQERNPNEITFSEAYQIKLKRLLIQLTGEPGVHRELKKMIDSDLQIKACLMFDLSEATKKLRNS